MAFDERAPFLRSPSFELHWLGWRATTASLHQAGWQFKGEEDEWDRGYRVLAREPRSGMTMGAHIRGDLIEAAIMHNRWGHYGPVPMSIMPTEFRYMEVPPIHPPFDAMEDLDMRPQFSTSQLCRPGDLFAKATPTGQPDVEPMAFEAEQIPEVLERIRELQAPRAREILHRSIREAEARKRILMPAQTFHANIVSVREEAA